jgi:hypothetical protein
MSTHTHGGPIDRPRRASSFDFTLVILDDAGRPHLAQTPEPDAVPANPSPGSTPGPAERRLE